MTSASVSVVISAAQETTRAPPSGVRKTRQWGRSGDAAGIRKLLPPSAKMHMCWLLARVPRDSNARAQPANVVTRSPWPKQRPLWGGRINVESTLPGFATWARVRDWRIGQLNKLTSVDIYLDSELGADDVADVSADYVVCATGARWRRDGKGAATPFGVDGLDKAAVLTPDDVLHRHAEPSGRVVIYDDDHYYMAGAIAERLALAGHSVVYMTPQARVSSWTEMTNEQHFVQARVLDVGVKVIANTTLIRACADSVTHACIYTGVEQRRACDTLILVTSRDSNDTLYRELRARGVSNLVCIGDCEAPGAIVHAVYAGHKFARELHEDINPDMPFLRERVKSPSEPIGAHR